MGIPKFWSLFEGTEIRLKDMRGMSFAVDASTEIYRAVLGMRNISALTTEDGEPTAHLNTLLPSITRLLAAGVNLIWVFDGLPHPRKADELQRRAELKAAASASGNERRAFGVTRRMVTDVQRLLDGLGVPYTTAPPEFDAEQVCACMTMNGEASHVLTTDADAFLYGATAVMKMEKGKFIEYRAENVYAKAGGGRELLIRVGMCLGNDFVANKIGRIGIKTVLTKCLDADAITSRYTDEHRVAYDIFMSECRGWIMVQPLTDHNALVQWLVGVKSFNGDRVRKLIARCV